MDGGVAIQTRRGDCIMPLSSRRRLLDDACVSAGLIPAANGQLLPQLFQMLIYGWYRDGILAAHLLAAVIELQDRQIK
jgi:hypothetical protein